MSSSSVTVVSPPIEIYTFRVNNYYRMFIVVGILHSRRPPKAGWKLDPTTLDPISSSDLQRRANGTER